MLFFGIIFAIASIYLLVAICQWNIEYLFIAMAITLFGSGFVCFPTFMADWPIDSIENITEIRELRALRNVSGVSKIQGSFFLGCGSISGGRSDRYYWWYERLEDGSTVCQRSGIDYVKLYEDGGKEVRYTFKRTEWHWLWGYCESKPPTRYIEFHIPKDGIFEEIDLQAK